MLEFRYDTQLLIEGNNLNEDDIIILMYLYDLPFMEMIFVNLVRNTMIYAQMLYIIFLILQVKISIIKHWILELFHCIHYLKKHIPQKSYALSC